jgi:hypothetical protein
MFFPHSFTLDNMVLFSTVMDEVIVEAMFSEAGINWTIMVESSSDTLSNSLGEA